MKTAPLFAFVQLRLTDQDRVDPEQVGALFEIGQDTGADRAAAEQGDAQRLPFDRHLLAGRERGDDGCFVMADGGDLDRDMLDLGGMDRLGLDQPGACFGRRVIVESAVALGARVLGRILGIDAVDVLQEAHPLRSQPGREEDRGEVGSAAAQGDDAMPLMAGGAGNDHVVIPELGVDCVGVEAAQVRIRAGLPASSSSVGIEGAGPDHPAQCERHQAERSSLPWRAARQRQAARRRHQGRLLDRKSVSPARGRRRRSSPSRTWR